MDINSLPDDPAVLKSVIADHRTQIAQLEQRLRLLNLIIYGPKSEKTPRTGQEQQLSLFDEAEQTVEEHKPQTFEEACAPAGTRRKRGRRPIPADLPRVEIIHDLPESEKACPCGAELVRIGEEVSEKLDIVPAKIQVRGNCTAGRKCPRRQGPGPGCAEKKEAWRRTPSRVAFSYRGEPIILWNTVYLERAIHLLRDTSQAIDEKLLPHLSPLGWEHINLTGDYIWRQHKLIEQGKFRPLRMLAEA
ncbi:putative transposase orf3 (plasmid) [Solidesulfovibrio magneticus RS-1]|uniref:Transposase orf3 n=1 Tax=Solidesulfovibrio magneticus (strain ATCC 700980 / DSM 13731 / RS-1) TaxID=573370 RepID=C4XUK7_SOLM1|nr:putative transposase orf3 [Solidesulfovibrio magneticus RS-1]